MQRLSESVTAMDNITQSIDPELLTEEQQQMADLIGLDNYAKLVQVYGGLSVYIPKPDAFLRAERNNRIRAEYNGYNVSQLALTYRLSVSQVRNIVQDLHTRHNKILSGQMSLFEFLDDKK